MLKRLAAVVSLSLVSWACGSSLPAHVANRPLRAGADPTGTWVLEGGEGTMVISAPREGGQYWDVRLDGIPAKALSDGDWLYVRSPETRISLSYFEKTGTGLEGVWGRTRLGWERATRIGAGDGFDGKFSVTGVNGFGGSYTSDLQVKAPGPAVPDVYDMLWPAGDGSYGGMGFEANGKLVFARWGIKVTDTQISSWGNSTSFTTTVENREWVPFTLAAFRINGDKLEGRSLDSETKRLTPQVWVRGR